MFKLKTQSSVDHFLEACSREERDEWAAAIIGAVEDLRQADGGAVGPQDPTSTQQHLQDINLRYGELWTDGEV